MPGPDFPSEATLDYLSQKMVKTSNPIFAQKCPHDRLLIVRAVARPFGLRVIAGRMIRRQPSHQVRSSLALLFAAVLRLFAKVIAARGDHRPPRGTWGSRLPRVFPICIASNPDMPKSFGLRFAFFVAYCFLCTYLWIRAL